MKINELMMSIHRDNFDIEKELQVKNYLPMEEKKIIARGIIYECTENVDGVIKVDSVQQYLSYVKYMILHHTNLEYAQDDYDKLCSTVYGATSLLNAIISAFQGDANECNRILNLMLNDYVNNNAAENQIVMSINKFLNDLSRLAESLQEKITDVIPSDLDMNMLKNFVNDNYK